MRQGAFTKTLTVSQGVFRKAGMKSVRIRAHAPTQTHAPSLFLPLSLSARTHARKRTLALLYCSRFHFTILTTCNTAGFMHQCRIYMQLKNMFTVDSVLTLF